MYARVQVTDLTDKQRRSFSCGNKSLDSYLSQYAKGNHNKNIGKTFAFVEDDDFVIGYYTISMGSIDFNSLPIEFSHQIPKYPIPVARLCRLAVDLKKQSNGWGRLLVIDALRNIQNAALITAAFGVVVDAKDEKAKNFYLKFPAYPVVT